MSCPDCNQLESQNAKLIKGVLAAEDYLDEILSLMRRAKMAEKDWRDDWQVSNLVKAIAIAKEQK